MSALLRARGLAKTYRVRDGWRSTRALRAVAGVDLEVPRGGTLGIVGESGCGKSTLARLLMGLIPASAGTVTLNGEPVLARGQEPGDRRWKAQRRRLQMVYQDPLSALDRRLPVGDQIGEPLDIQRIGTPAARRDAVRALMQAVGLPAEMAARFPHEMSGGQRQRAVLARALILEPDLLVCDEPVSALDVSVAAQVMNLLADIQEARGTAYVFISHDLKMVNQIAHEVAVMYLGRIVEQGPPEAVLRSPAHPYTEALVGAAHSLSRPRARVVLQGAPPNPVDVPPGCPFHPRCPRVLPRCRTEAPPLARVADGRLAACHLVPPASAAVAA